MYSMNMNIEYHLDNEDNHKMRIDYSDSAGINTSSSVESDNYDECVNAACQELMEDVFKAREELSNAASKEEPSEYDYAISDLIDDNIVLSRKNEELQKNIDELQSRINELQDKIDNLGNKSENSDKFKDLYDIFFPGWQSYMS